MVLTGFLADRAFTGFATRCQRFRNGQFSLAEPLAHARGATMREIIQMSQT
jgi:hypothetical protein